MKKRRLSEQQRNRIHHLQEERLVRSKRHTYLAEHDALGPAREGRVIAHYGLNLDVEDKEGQIFPCVMRQNLTALVTGDRVIWHEGKQGQGVVSALMPRTSELIRPDRYGKLKPIAANIDLMFIVIAPEPEADEYLIDRYLVAAELTHIKPVIVLNKIDLLTKQQYKQFEQRFAYYQKIGYAFIHASANLQKGLHEIIELLADKTAVFVGQSGVGKSSLLAALLPEKDIEVGDLSEGSKLGKHTTTTARFYHLPTGGDVIDSPGVREFALSHFDTAQVIDGFVDLKKYAAHCKFRNCFHQREPNCAVKQAIVDGEIVEKRLQSLHRILGLA